jgi:hypothetical protein
VYERHGADTKVVDFNLLEGFMEDTFLAYGVEPSDAALCANVRASCSRLPHPVSSRFRLAARTATVTSFDHQRRNFRAKEVRGTSVRRKFVLFDRGDEEEDPPC